MWFFHLRNLQSRGRVRNRSWWPPWCWICPFSVVAEAYIRPSSQLTRKLSQWFHPTCFYFPLTYCTQHILPSRSPLSSNIFFHQFVINQSWFSSLPKQFSPLHKIPMVNDYLCNQGFLHWISLGGKWSCMAWEGEGNSHLPNKHFQSYCYRFL